MSPPFMLCCKEMSTRTACAKPSIHTFPSRGPGPTLKAFTTALGMLSVRSLLITRELVLKAWRYELEGSALAGSLLSREFVDVVGLAGPDVAPETANVDATPAEYRGAVKVYNMRTVKSGTRSHFTKAACLLAVTGSISNSNCKSKDMLIPYVPLMVFRHLTYFVLRS